MQSVTFKKGVRFVDSNTFAADSNYRLTGNQRHFVQFQRPENIKVYFEITIMASKNPENIFGIGLAPHGYSEGMPGWYAQSIGWHGDDGIVFNNQSTGTPENTLGTFGLNDTVGCLWNQSNGEIQFTKNGVLLPKKFFRSNIDLYPSVGFKDKSDHFRVRLVPPFVYPFDPNLPVVQVPQYSVPPYATQPHLPAYSYVHPSPNAPAPYYHQVPPHTVPAPYHQHPAPNLSASYHHQVPPLVPNYSVQTQSPSAVAAPQSNMVSSKASTGCDPARFELTLDEASTLPFEQLNKVEQALQKSLKIVSQVKEVNNVCTICLDAKKEIVFLPCQHCATCQACSSLVESCPMCRQPITQKLRIFL